MSVDRSTSPSPTPTPHTSANYQLTTHSPRYVAGPVRPGTILTASRHRDRDGFDRILDYLRRLARERFYGACTITLRDGAVELVRTEQTLKLSEISTTTTPGEAATALGTTTTVLGGGR
jgi:hypothetical protein